MILTYIYVLFNFSNSIVFTEKIGKFKQRSFDETLDIAKIIFWISITSYKYEHIGSH
jgi:hypothetical protein